MHLLRAVLLVELLVCQAAQVGVEALEQVLEQQRQQPTRQLQPLVAVVVPAAVHLLKRSMQWRIADLKPASISATATSAAGDACDSVCICML
jgi:hypothetical protein